MNGYVKLVVLGLVVLCSSAEARTWRLGRAVYRERTVVTARYEFSGSAQQVCEQKAALQARLCRMFHPGGSFGGGSCEGVAMASDPTTALNSTCYSRSGRVCIGQAVVRGANGMFYACRIFR